MKVPAGWKVKLSSAVRKMRLWQLFLRFCWQKSHVFLENIPNINDVNISLQILQELGAKIKIRNKTTVEIDATHIIAPSVPFDIARNMRASYYFLGALLGRYSKGAVTMPGGCNFGGCAPLISILKGLRR